MSEAQPQPFNLAELAKGLFKPNEASPALMDLLAQLPRPLTIRDRWFKDQTLHIDGYTFERCRFDRCSLVSQWATFTFRQCVISGDCGLYFKALPSRPLDF